MSGRDPHGDNHVKSTDHLAARPFDVIGLGTNALDLVAIIDGYPRPDTKVQFQEFNVRGAGPVATGMAAGGPDGIVRVHLGMKVFYRRIRAG